MRTGHTQGRDRVIAAGIGLATTAVLVGIAVLVGTGRAALPGSPVGAIVGPPALMAAADPSPSPLPSGWVRYFVVGPPVNGQPEYLFAIATRTLGDGNRATELFQLNRGRPQPDGQTMTDPTVVLRPGWILLLPADATGPGVLVGPLPTPTPVRSTAPTPARAGGQDGGSTPLVSALGLMLVVAIAIVAVHLLRRGRRLRLPAWPGQLRPAAVLGSLADRTPPVRRPRSQPPPTGPAFELPPARDELTPLDQPDPAGPDRMPFDPSAADATPFDRPAPDRTPFDQPAADGTPVGPPPFHRSAVPVRSAGPPPFEPLTAGPPPFEPPPFEPPAFEPSPSQRRAARRERSGAPGSPAEVAASTREEPVADLLTAEVNAASGTDRATVRLAGVRLPRTTAPWLWLDVDAAGPPAPTYIAVGARQGRALCVDLVQAPDVLTVTGDGAKSRRLATALAEQLIDRGAAVTVVGPAVGGRPAKAHVVRSLAEAETATDDPGAVQIVFSGPVDQDAAVLQRLIGRASPRTIVVLVGDVPAGRWSLEVW